MTCPYINSLDRECGRDALPGHGGFCPFHHVLNYIDGQCLDSPVFVWLRAPVDPLLIRVRERIITRIGEMP